jgi:hypothetical protein
MPYRKYASLLSYPLAKTIYSASLSTVLVAVTVQLLSSARHDSSSLSKLVQTNPNPSPPLQKGGNLNLPICLKVSILSNLFISKFFNHFRFALHYCENISIDSDCVHFSYLLSSKRLAPLCQFVKYSFTKLLNYRNATVFRYPKISTFVTHFNGSKCFT